MTNVGLRRFRTGRLLIITLVLMLLHGCASAPKATPPAPPPTSATAGATTIVAIAPPAAGPHTTLPKFLGLPELASGIGGIFQRVGSRLANALDLTGRFPALQPQPPLVPLTDPANLDPGAPPAVQAAAEIKAEEDAAPQKVMAIRYLATLGCGGCYEKVEDALLQAMSDCTEVVRFEAVKALQCRPDCGCKYCNSPSCCSPAIRKRLEELITCEKEPSDRIRRMSRLALACCNTKPLEAIDDVPREGPPAAPPLEEVALASHAIATRSISDSPANSSVSELFADIQLVSFQSSAARANDEEPMLAQVNGEPIFRSQLLPLVDTKLERLSPSGIRDESARQRVFVEELQRVIDWKLLEQLARAEIRPANSQTVGGLSPAEVQAWFERKTAIDPIVDPAELVAFYQVHRDRYTQPARVRWERIAVLVAECSSRQQAAAIAAYLHQRALGGQAASPVDFDRRMIQSESYAWCELAKLESAVVRNVLSSLQPGQVSRVVDENSKLCLYRVLERDDAKMLPLPLVTESITAEILKQRRAAAVQRFMVQARASGRIWTASDAVGSTSAAPARSISLLSGSD